MILYALIVRTHDGLPLSASTDVGGQVYREVQETRKHMKALARKLTRLDDRCTLRLNRQHVIHFISSMGVSFLALCEISYQAVLAFSFLDELMREFIVLYNTQQINKAVRPYAFIEFDSHIQKMRQRYNSSRTLASRVNLSNLMEEIKQRPPQQLKLEDVLSEVSVPSSPVQSIPGLDVRLAPLSIPGHIMMTITATCALFDLYRGVALLGESSLEEFDGGSPMYGLLCLFESVLYCCQIYLLLNYSRWRTKLAAAVLLAFLLCSVLLGDIQDLVQMLLFVGVALLTSACILLRRKQTKMPNYNV